MVFKKGEKRTPGQTAGASQEATKDTVAKKATRKPGMKKVQETYSVYIYRVLKQVHPETGISKRSMSIMNSFINDIFEKISSESAKLVRYNKK